MLKKSAKFVVLFFVVSVFNFTLPAQEKSCDLKLSVLEFQKDNSNVKEATAILEKAHSNSTVSSTVKNEMPFFSNLSEDLYIVVVSVQGYKKTAKMFRLNCSSNLTEQKIFLWKGLQEESVRVADDPFFVNFDNYRDLFKTSGFSNTLKTPSYPAEAKKSGVKGKITVGVTVDEKGNVISAEVKNKFNLFSVSSDIRKGYFALWKAAEEAAMQSKFSPTFLVGNFVKVTGTIDYNFVP